MVHIWNHSQINSVRNYNIKLFATQPGPNLVTLVRTCENEVFNNAKTVILPKRMNIQNTFDIQYYYCLLERHEGFMHTFQTLINLLDLPYSTSSDKHIIAHNQDLVHSKRMVNSEMIGERNKAYADKLQEFAINHGKFDPTQSLVEYGVTHGTTTYYSTGSTTKI